ncbi:uncharacterized protein LOC129780615 [Toxorhynchites rutilus septentrionalis]|uniref:uncharacterized protein LOC129780615 n=1 Tax=Toxorhynchites rutilus septentrionalis TaxID=329112 RepID=UPI002479D2CB|nr:uncharacterized protein LOC129780615 [Toxorhynchites rutilus septentrionalis]
MPLEGVEKALQENQPFTAEQLLREAYDQKGAADIFYQVIRNGSVPAFKLLLTMNICNDTETFLQCSNAMIELGVKNVSISWEMSQHLLYRISSYGLRNLSGDPVVTKSESYWKESIALISRWVHELRKRGKWYEFLAVDDEVMFRIAMIHNQLYFIKNHPALLRLPLKELIFCLAVFIHIFSEIPGSFAFRTVLNKRNVMQFLIAIVAHLERIRQQEEEKGRGEMRKTKPKKMHVMKKLLKTYRRTKHIYTTFKVILGAQIYRQFSDKDYERANAPTTVAAMKRFIQIFGEAIKNTADSPNLSTKLHNTLYGMLSESISLNSKYRNFSSHGFPLSYLYVRDTEQIFYYKNLPDYIFLIEVSMQILCVYTLHDSMRYQYGMMRRCRSIEDLRALIVYACGNEISDLQEFLFKRITSFLSLVKNDLKEAEGDPLSEAERKDLADAWDNLNQKVVLVEELRKMQFHRTSAVTEIIAFANGNISSIHRLLDLKFTDSSSSRDVFTKIIDNWETLSPPAFLSKDYRGTIVQSYVHRRLELEHDHSEEWRYREKSREIFEFFMSGSNLDGDTLRRLEDELHTVLCKSQNGYYLNIFDLNCKAHANKLTLKEAFTGPKKSKEFKQRKLEFKSKLAELRRQDEIQLREIFQTLISNIRQSFLQYGCDNIDNFIQHRNTIPLKAHFAIQYWQLQVMEILCGTGFFGDNFIT